MKENVIIKGSKSGISLVLNPDIDFEKLKEDVAKKFKESAEFLGEASKAISFQGRKLSDDEKVEIIELIHENSKLSIVCIMEENERLDAVFESALKKQKQALMQADYSTGQFFKGNLRSGQVLDVETSIIILGDVKAGAKVISKGNVIILGSLHGNVYAGSDGNVNAFVVALDMNPVQIRIADTIARAPDKEVKKIRKDKKVTVKETKIAFWDSGNIYIEPLDKDVMSDIRL